MTRVRLVALAAMLLGASALAVQLGCQSSASPSTPMDFGDAFWRHWGDGRAELAGYDLTFPRYGAARKGVAVTIFVTETFSNSLRVKADPGRHPQSDEFPVIKLNLVRDFPTGIYDYNVMTSAFVTLAEANGRPAGSPTKISFSSQEWCGHVYAQLLFDRNAARLVSHSYFDGEADQQQELAVTAGAISEDALLLWARGLAAPALAPGDSRQVDLVRSLLVARLFHRPVVVEQATLARARDAQRVTVPAGTFDVEVLRAEIAGKRTWTFYVERAEPRRIVRWETNDGERADLLASDRLKYWEMNGPGFLDAVAKLGLTPRPFRTP